MLPHQYAWAMVANYDVHDTNQHNQAVGQSHFGHHEHHKNSSISFSDVKTNTADKESQTPNNQAPSNQAPSNHMHFGFCHLSCGEVLNYSLPVFEALSVQFLSQYSLVYPTPTANVLDRPKWLQLI
ncbi:MAG: hypothetical protein ABIP37_01290 [Methylotenera sp.]